MALFNSDQSTNNSHKESIIMKNVNCLKQILLFLFIVLTTLFATAQGGKSVATCNVVWNSLGTNENSSMPLGNGDIALNIWTEQSGDIVLLIAKSDAWSENGQLLKLGRVRVKLTPNPFVSPT